jgi:hypothetical protein
VNVEDDATALAASEARLSALAAAGEWVEYDRELVVYFGLLTAWQAAA